MTRMIFVRHGESMANLAHAFAGQSDVPLSARGHAQAELTADYIKKNYRVDAVVASDLCRAYDTAVHIASRFDLPVQREPAFRELYAGDWEGLAFEEIAVRFSHDYHIWRTDIGRARPTRGESFVELYGRVNAAAAHLAEKYAGKTVVVGTHATVIRVLECAWRHVTFADAQKVPFVANASVSVVEYENGTVTVCLCGYHDHHGELSTGLPRGSAMKYLYPMKLTYEPRYRIWGGDRLKTAFGKKAPSVDRLGETWELTVRPDGMSRVQNGCYTGMSLDEVIAVLGHASVSPTYDGACFPLLIKLIDAQDKLSVQVHPDDAYAARVEQDVGKTEMWYVLSAEEGATLVDGLLPGVDRAAFAAAVREGRTEEVLATRPVQAGDICFIPSGLVHAIGAGIVVAEIQQNSDLTYRVYDYDRRDSQGRLRELHIDRALDVTRPFTAAEIADLRFAARDGKDDGDTLVHCRYFRARRLSVAGTREETVDESSFVALLCVEGEGALAANGETYPVKKGDLYFLPAGMGAYVAEGGMTLLSASV